MAEIRVGKPDTTQTSPSHVKGVKGGNDPGGYERMTGHLPDGKATAARSTGVNAEKRNPIDPNSPNLSPA
jgi:hypothetical protein